MLIRCNYNDTVLLQSLHLPPFHDIPLTKHKTNTVKHNPS